MDLDQNNQTLIDLLAEKAKREAFAQAILSSLPHAYSFVAPESVTARQSATAGHVYSYLALALNQTNNPQFQKQVKALLLERKLIVPSYTKGIWWWKGLIAKDVSSDQAVANRVLQQHYRDRALHRARQAEFAKASHLKT